MQMKNSIKSSFNWVYWLIVWINICPTCPSPAGGSLILNQAFPLTIKGKDVTAH